MEQFTGTLGILVIFGAIIAIHEFGHFIAAKWSGMGVYEFSLGFGPALFKREYRGTLYAVRIIPLGGYVRIAGMEAGEEDSPNGYDKKPFFAKFATLAAGATMNFLLALVIFIVIGLTIGYYKLSDKPVIGEIVDKSPAAQVGMQAGDRIVAINDTPTTSWSEVVGVIRANDGPKTIDLDRQGQTITVTVTPVLTPMPERKGLRLYVKHTSAIGIAPSGAYVRENPLISIQNGFIGVVDRTMLVVASLVSMVSGDIPAKEIGGPVAIMRISYSASQGAFTSADGLARFFGFLAFLSVNIGFMNLLPIPALDGGRLVFLFVEGIRRKPMAKEREAMIHAIGMVILLGLILLVTVKDIWGWIGGK